MSNQQHPDSQLTDIPDEVKELQAALGDLSAYRTVMKSVMVPGGMAEPTTRLQKFIEETYQQVLKQFNEHPYVVKARKDAEEAAQALKGQ
jgi:hypothetical protein